MRRTRTTRVAHKGFTLIELAVVIAIIAILAAVAIPRFGNVTASAERSMIKDLSAQLASSASIYTAEQSATPTGFADFVVATGSATKPKTMSLAQFGTTPGKCTVGTTISCAGSFQNYDGVTYAWNDGAVTVTATPKNGAPAIQ